MVSNLTSIKRSPSSTRELKNVTLTGQTPLWSSRMCSRAITKQPGNRCFMSTSQSLSMRRCQDRLCKIVAQKKASIKQFSSLFSKCCTRKSLEIGGIFTCSPAELHLPEANDAIASQSSSTIQRDDLDSRSSPSRKHASTQQGATA
jgi:hypothetical protein